MISCGSLDDLCGRLRVVPERHVRFAELDFYAGGLLVVQNNGRTVDAHLYLPVHVSPVAGRESVRALTGVVVRRVGYDGERIAHPFADFDDRVDSARVRWGATELYAIRVRRKDF